MDMSPDGRLMLTGFAKSESPMYHDPVGLPTIGIGHLLTKDELSSGKILVHGVFFSWGDGLSSGEINALLLQDTMVVTKAITDMVNVPLTQNQFNALTSLVFNIGTKAFRYSTLLKKLNVGDYSSVPDQIRRWVYSKGMKLPILVERREKEAALWSSLT